MQSYAELKTRIFDNVTNKTFVNSLRILKVFEVLSREIFVIINFQYEPDYRYLSKNSSNIRFSNYVDIL